MKASEKLWWMKIIAAVIVAIASYGMQILLHVDGTTIFMAGTLIYLAVSELFSNANKIERNRGLKIGIGAYFFTWIMVWVLLYTLSYTMV